jgi:nicotinamide-nucleotide amidase
VSQGLLRCCGILKDLSLKGKKQTNREIVKLSDEYALAERVGKLLKTMKMTMAVAESCTGGMLGGRLTAVPGSSAYFLGGVIAYDDSVKVALLRVPAQIVREHGAVSAESALAMAQGVREITGADLGLSITGVAGPGGGTEEKPVGTTYIALVGGPSERLEQRVWRGDRTANREQSVRLALQMIIEYLEGIL